MVGYTLSLLRSLTDEPTIARGLHLRFNECLYPKEAVAMNTAKEEVRAVLEQLPDDCSIEDVQYHLYVVEKIHRGIERAGKVGTLSQEAAERKLDRWTLM